MEEEGREGEEVRINEEKKQKKLTLSFPLALVLAALLFFFGLLGDGIVSASAAVGVFACVGRRG